MKIRWTLPAVDALEQIVDYIALDNPVAATDTAELIYSAVEHLADHPQMGRRGRIEGTRELIIAGTPYLVPYRVKPPSIEILTVLHASRKYP